ANDALTWSNLGAAAWAQGHLVEADEAYAKSLSISRDNLSIVRNHARLLIERQQLERAIKLLEEALNRDPLDVATWLLAANALELAAEFTQAILAYRRALSLAPLTEAAQYRLAMLLIHHGSLAEAEQVVQQILSARPASAETWATFA